MSFQATYLEQPSTPLLELTTLEEVKALLEFEDNVRDIVLIKLIKDVSAEIEMFLNRSTAIVTNAVEYFDVPQYGAKLFLRAYPITSVTTLWNTTDRTYDSTTVVDSDNYYVDKQHGAITVDKQYLLMGAGAVKIQYTGGMASTTATFLRDYRGLASAIATEVMYRFQRNAEIGLIAASGGGSNITLQTRTQFHPSVETVLQEHRRISA